MEVPDDAVVRILTSLGFGVSPTSDGWDVVGPPWRIDVNRPVDLIEEVGRHYGYEHLPSTFPAVQQAPPPSDPRIARDRRVRAALLGMGFSEAITFAFIEASAADPYLLGQQGVTIANPLSEKFAVMRPSLLPGLVDALSHNRRHGRPDVRLFEIGTRFSPAGETRGAALAWTGLATPEDWSGNRRAVDFFDVKGVAEQLAEVMGAALTLDPAAPDYLLEGRRASLIADGTAVGAMGELVPAIGAARDLPAGEAVYVAELDLDALSAAAETGTRLSTPLPRFPAVVRDLAIVVDDTLSAEKVRETIRSAAPDTLVQLAEFDRYQGKGIPDGKVSLALHLTFQSADRTLTDAEVQAAMLRIRDALAGTLNAVLR
jgi:phenylalanyl-tRNA synthetase beta chain